jgi:hypothetical protein
MISVIPVFETAAGVGAVIACLLGAIALFEKITGLLGKWVRRNVTEALSDTNKQLTDLDNYTHYHLGPNGTTTPVFVRIKQLEQTLDQLLEKDH